jgi:shikimate kinase
MSRNLVLAGPPGVGKSTVGALCAARLGWRLVDTDEELVRRQGLPVAEIFARHGEAHFRGLEAALCRELASASQLVIASGGGTVVHEPSRTALLQNSVGVCLSATTPELARRLGPDAGLTRPLLRPQAPTDTLNQRLDALLETRATAYAALPYHLDTTSATPAAVAEIACGLVAAEKERLIVTHPTGSYDLVIGAALLDYVGYALAGRGYSGPLAIVSDSNVGPLYAARVQASHVGGDLSGAQRWGSRTGRSSDCAWWWGGWGYRRTGCRDVSAWGCPGAGADVPAGDGGLQHRRQGRGRHRRGQKSGGRL